MLIGNRSSQTAEGVARHGRECLRPSGKSFFMTSGQTEITVFNLSSPNTKSSLVSPA
jgi:hypothetical protein